MRGKLKSSAVVWLLAGLLLAAFLMWSTHRKQTARLPAAPHERAAVEGVPAVAPEVTGITSTENDSLGFTTHTQGVSTVRKTQWKAALPTGITFTAGALGVERPVLLPLVDAVSNAVLSTDRILKAGDYQVNEFGRSVWLTSEDKERLIVWTIFPYRTNNVVGSVEATAYQDATLTLKDPSRSFRMSFHPETGALLSFSWADKHEVLIVRTNNWAVNYARHLKDKKRLVMRWDAQGNLVSSNVYDWAKRGRVIGGSPQSNKTAYRIGPTSSVEAATESWRRKNE
ncbi:MAG: hypothetical protein ACOX5G_03025 [Kiritimatiellia bacterium]|jgi:hypothetical protein